MRDLKQMDVVSMMDAKLPYASSPSTALIDGNC